MGGDTDSVTAWLMKGDPAIRWQVIADLQDGGAEAVARERARVARAGWGRKLLALQDEDSRWANGLYTPKWTSTTYTLLLLRALGLTRDSRGAREGTLLLLDSGLYRDGGINLWLPRRRCSETCVTGMILGIASRFLPEDSRIETLAQHLVGQQMDDGGWNCERPRGATHGSLHTTISALEGLLEYENAGGAASARTRAARECAHEFLARHRLFRSHRTGAVIDERMTRFSFPPHWHYDVLRGLDYLQSARAQRDPRFGEAIELVRNRRLKDGTWALQNFHRGRYHFQMEVPGEPSRWNTLRALRILRWWEGADPSGAA